MSQMMEYFGKDKFNYIKKHTTRPPRSYEEDEYYFVSVEEFVHKLLDYNGDGFAEASSYAGHFYGTHESELLGNDFINVGIFDLTGLDAIMDGDYDTFILKVETPPDIRLTRMVKRDPHLVTKSAERFIRDEKEFMNLEDSVTVDYFYDNQNEGLNDVAVARIWEALEKKWWS